MEQIEIELNLSKVNFLTSISRQSNAQAEELTSVLLMIQFLVMT